MMTTTLLIHVAQVPRRGVVEVIFAFWVLGAVEVSFAFMIPAVVEVSCPFSPGAIQVILG